MPDESLNRLSRRVRSLEEEVAELRQLLAQAAGGTVEKKGADESPPIVSDQPSATPVATPEPVPSSPMTTPSSNLPPPPSGVKPTSDGASVPPTQPVSTRREPPSRGWEIPDQWKQSEFWLGKLGIGLLLLGVIFLFLYSIDKGWITPLLRILFGLAIGLTLLIFGLRIYTLRRHFSLILLGGGVATFYITGFAAFQVFQLVSHPVAFIFLVGVTALSFFISLRQNEAILSMVATIGGLGTPFLLYTGQDNLPGLVAYTCLILAGTAGVYFYKGWRSILWLSFIGGWIVFIIGLWNLPILRFNGTDYNALYDRWALQIGILFGWLTFWAVPLLREVAGVRWPDRWKPTFLGIADNRLNERVRTVLDRHVHKLTIASPIFAIFISHHAWHMRMPDQTWGFLEMGLAAFYVLIWWLLNKTEPLAKLAQTHLFTAAILLAMSLADLFDGHTLLFSLATEAFALRLLANRFKSRMFSFGSHFFFGILALWLFDRLGLWALFELDGIGPGTGTPMLNAQAIADFYAIAVAFVAVSILKTTNGRRFYFIACFAALAGLTIREFDGNNLLVVLVVESTLMHILSRLLADDAYVISSHLFTAGLAIWLGERLLFENGYGIPGLNGQALTDLGLLGALLLTSTFFRQTPERLVYRMFVHVALLAWFSRELLPLPNGQGFISVAWGVYAIALLIAGLRMNHRQLRLVGLGTILLVVAKLFIIDLARLEALWRILLFIGFGGLFLLISYYFRRLWKSPDAKADDRDIVS